MSRRRRFGLLAFGVRARDGGAIGILSITNKQSDNNGLRGLKLPEPLRWTFYLFFPNRLHLISWGAAERAGG